jgi:hypothetical protein
MGMEASGYPQKSQIDVQSCHGGENMNAKKT